MGSLVAVYCCTCLRPKQPSQPIRFSLRSYQTETLPMILASTSFRTPSRQSSTATSSSSTGGSVRRFSFPRAEPGCLVSSPPPPYTSGCFQTAHAVHLTQPSGFLVSPPYFGYPLQPEPALAGKSCSDFSQSWKELSRNNTAFGSAGTAAAGCRTDMLWGCRSQNCSCGWVALEKCKVSLGISFPKIGSHLQMNNKIFQTYLL